MGQRPKSVLQADASHPLAPLVALRAWQGRQETLSSSFPLVGLWLGSEPGPPRSRCPPPGLVFRPRGMRPRPGPGRCGPRGQGWGAAAGPARRQPGESAASSSPDVGLQCQPRAWGAPSARLTSTPAESGGWGESVCVVRPGGEHPALEGRKAEAQGEDEPEEGAREAKAGLAGPRASGFPRLPGGSAADGWVSSRQRGGGRRLRHSGGSSRRAAVAPTGSPAGPALGPRRSPRKARCFGWRVWGSGAWLFRPPLGSLALD